MIGLYLTPPLVMVIGNHATPDCVLAEELYASFGRQYRSFSCFPCTTYFEGPVKRFVL